jgi:serum/glucocorticoid-regulated kinase 2
MYNIFWNSLVEKYPKVSEYLFKQKEDNLYIDAEEKVDSENVSIFPIKKKNQELKIENENKKATESFESKKNKTRRKNPHSQQNTEEEVKLIDDSTLTKGITFASFDVLECLGSGTFGKVFKVKLKDSGQIFAMKIINKKFLIKNQQLRYAVTECNVLKLAKHPFIITLHYAFQTPDHLYMILDYCPGGDFSYHIIKNLLEEDEAKFFIAELVLAIEHLHNMDIIYRDLKPENILIDSEGHIRLADFGLAKENVSDNKIAQSFCGSPAYLSPEMVNRRGVGKAADIYGIGAVLYEMLSGTPPFYANDLNTMYRNISSNNLMVPDYFSEELKDLLKVF